jgi:hypothetical protein
MFAFHQVGVMATKDPKLKDVEPIKTVLSLNPGAFEVIKRSPLGHALGMAHVLRPFGRSGSL